MVIQNPAGFVPLPNAISPDPIVSSPGSCNTVAKSTAENPTTPNIPTTNNNPNNPNPNNSNNNTNNNTNSNSNNSDTNNYNNVTSNNSNANNDNNSNSSNNNDNNVTGRTNNRNNNNNSNRRSHSKLTNLTTTPDFTCEELLQEIVDYAVGSVFQAQKNGKNKKMRAKLLRILLFGCSNTGKTSLLISIFTALKNQNFVQWGFRDWKVSASRSSPITQATTTNTASYPLSDALPELRQGGSIELVDIRGTTEERNAHEPISLIDASQPADEPVARTQAEADKLRRERFESYRGDRRLREFDAGVLVIPSDLLKGNEELMGLYRKTLQEIPKWFPMVYVVTGTDIQPDIRHVLAGLNLNESQILKFVPYHSADYNNAKVPANDKVNEATNAQALNVLRWAINRADAEGLGVRSRPLLARWGSAAAHALRASARHLLLAAFVLVLAVLLACVFTQLQARRVDAFAESFQ